MVAERFPIEGGHVQMFSRALGITEPATSGSWSELPEFAPPTFVQASACFDPDALFRPRDDEPWMGSGSTPCGTADQDPPEPSLHAEQRFEYARQVRVGDVLTARIVPGETWTKTNRRGEMLRFTETVTEYRDSQGELVVTATGVVVRFGPEEK